jgi:putative hydrolase of HD superfamily
LLEDLQADPLIRTYYEFNHLKHLYRQGWLQHGVPPEVCESVAEHTFATAVLALILAETHFPELDACKVLRLALLHDFGEIYVGDLTPRDRVQAKEKQEQERHAVQRVFAKLANGERYTHLWEEYEQGESPEARFVREVDRLEMAFQASVYRQLGQTDMEDFFASTGEVVQRQPLRKILKALLAGGEGEQEI